MSTPAKIRPATAPVVVTANDLRTGRVVWLGSAGWIGDVAAARVFGAGDAAAALALGQAAEQARIVVGAYVVEVSAGPVPLKFRERLRAQGPSIDAEPRATLRLAS
ncbi:MAG: DUF2849 domain-containing protein [Roseomonas sp.]|nr:DUF2849 domain-containing protein [Roseomonas sp.]